MENETSLYSTISGITEDMHRQTEDEVRIDFKYIVWEGGFDMAQL